MRNSYVTVTNGNVTGLVYIAPVTLLPLDIKADNPRTKSCYLCCYQVNNNEGVK